MPNSTMINMGLTCDGSSESSSLMDKWKDHFHRKTKNSSAKNFSRILFVFQATTQLYVTLRYIIPYVFSDYDPWTIYYLKVLATYIFIMSMANWLCVILYDTSVGNSKDRPFPINTLTTRSKLIFQPHQIKARSNTDQDIIPNSNMMVTEQNCNSCQEKDEIKWRYCLKCNLKKPPRAHHCDICRKCILKRDHHCYLVGTCIGFKNQRYFVVLTFYSIIVGYWGFYITYVYLRDNMWPDASVSDIMLPITIYRTIIGNIQAYHTIMIFHCYMLSSFGPMATIYFFSQMTIIAKGLTLYELIKQVPVKNTSTVSKNCRSVFGDFWAINFIFPAQIILRQPDDGQTWDSVKIVKSDNNFRGFNIK